MDSKSSATHLFREEAFKKLEADNQISIDRPGDVNWNAESVRAVTSRPHVIRGERVVTITGGNHYFQSNPPVGQPPAINPTKLGDCYREKVSFNSAPLRDFVRSLRR